MATDLVEHFTSLSKPERARGLKELAHALTVDERKLICASINAKDDPFEILPVELLLHIFSYLDILETWPSQLVSRRWREVLSSEPWMKAVLSRWNSHHARDQGRPEASVARDSLAARLRHVLAVRRGKPATQTVWVTDADTRDSTPRYLQTMVDLKGGTVAYICGHTVFLNNLVTGQRVQFRGEAREKIMSVVLTSSIIAFITYQGTLYATEIMDCLDLPEQRSVQLPSSRIRASAGDGHVVVLAVGGGEADSPLVDSLLIYEAQRDILKRVEVSIGLTIRAGNARQSNSCALSVHTESRMIDIFSLSATYEVSASGVWWTGHVTVSHHRFAFDGSTVCSTDYHHTLPAATCNDDTQYVVLPPRPSGLKNEVRIQIAETSVSKGITEKHGFDIYFHTNACMFTPPPAAKDRRYCLISSQKHSLSISRPFNSELTAEWKGLQFTIAHPEEATQMRSWTLANETFLVNFGYNGLRSRVKVYCFDEKVKMDGGVDYKYFPEKGGWETAHEQELARGNVGLGDLYWRRYRLIR